MTADPPPPTSGYRQRRYRPRDGDPVVVPRPRVAGREAALAGPVDCRPLRAKAGRSIGMQVEAIAQSLALHPEPELNPVSLADALHPGGRGSLE